MHLAAPKRGETVVHIGAGHGYYTAILSELVGPDGRVIAVEYDEKSAQRAKANLADRTNVSVVHGNGFDWPKDEADVVYVNFATSHPAETWIENLNIGGRLAFPLGVPPSRSIGGSNLNAVSFLVTRADGGYAVAPIAAVSFVFAEGLGPEPNGQEFKAVYKSLAKGGWNNVKSLIWRKPADDERCWHVGRGWALSFDEISA
jgi:protein-L-isoaspartate(D-aspartate) O-methyltransferase